MSELRVRSEPAHVTVQIPRRALQLCADKLPAGVTVLMVPPDAFPPEFVRLPEEKEMCSVTGMSRGWLLDRIKESQKSESPIRSHHIRKKGSLRGVVLIERSSLIQWIQTQPPPSWGTPVERSSE